MFLKAKKSVQNHRNFSQSFNDPNLKHKPMRFLICLLIIVYTLPSQSQEASYCVSSLNELTTDVKKKSKATLYYPEFGKMGLYLTIKFGSSTYYLESKYAKIEYDTKTKALNAVCDGTKNCILSGKLTAPNRQSKKQLAILSKASTSDLQCYAGYLNQQIRRLKYNNPIAKFNVNKEQSLQDKKSDSRQKTTREKEKRLTALEDKVLSSLDHEAKFKDFKTNALREVTDCINTVNKIFDTFNKKVKVGDKDSFRPVFVSVQPLEEEARQNARMALMYIKNGRNYAIKHKMQEAEWNSL